MYRLKQAAILAYKLLVNRLESDEYFLVPLTNGLFKHKTQRTTFALCVDDFGVKYNSDDDLQHLIHTLQKNYSISIDKSRRNYCRLIFDLQYQEGYIHVTPINYWNIFVLQTSRGSNNPSRVEQSIYIPKCYNNRDNVTNQNANGLPEHVSSCNTKILCRQHTITCQI